MQENRFNGMLFPLGFTLVALMVARGWLQYPHSYSVDDVFLYVNSVDPSFYISQGRWGQALILKLSQFLQLDLLGGTTLFTLFYGLQIAFSVLLLIRSLPFVLDKWTEVALLCLACLHPYWCDVFQFKAILVLFSMSFCYPAIAVGYHMLGKASYSNKGLGILLIVWALANYQATLTLILVFIPFELFYSYYKQTDGGEIKKRLIKVVWFGLSIVLYGLSVKLIMAALSVPPDPRAGLLDWTELSLRFQQLGELYTKVLFRHEAFALGLGKILLFIVLLFSIYKLFITSSKKGTGLIRVGLYLLTFVVGAIGLLGVQHVLKVWWPTPRLLTHLGFLWALALIPALKNIKENRPLILLGSLILLSYLYSNNRIMSDRLKANLLDTNRANRIVSRLEQVKDFRKKKIYMFHGGFNYEQKIGTAYMDVNISAFGPPYTRVEILELTSGYNLLRATEKEVKPLLHLKDSMPAFPEEGSIRVVEDYILIKP